MRSSHLRSCRGIVTAVASLAVVVASLAAARPAAADVLAGWNFNALPGGAGNWGPSPMTPTTMAANLTTVGLTRGPGVSTGTAGASSSAAARAWGGNTWWGGTSSPDSLDNAITRGAFVTFSLTASEGYALSFSDVAPYNVRRSASGPTLGQWQYQIGSGSFANIGTTITWGGTTTGGGNGQSTIALSGISALQNVAAGSTVTFRIVNFNSGTAGSTTGTWYLNDPSNTAADDFIINGAVSGTGGGSNLFWNGGSGWATTISATGGNGTWTDGSGNWDTSKTANFGGTAGTVTLSTPTAANGLAFTASGYTLTGGTLALGGPSIDTNLIAVSAGGTTTINSVIAGSAGLTKGGAGRLVLGGSNTFFGGVRLQSGTLAISADAALGDASNGLEFNGGALVVPGSIDLGSRAISGTLSAPGIATISVPGGATLSSSGAVNLAALTLPGSGTLNFTGGSTNLGGISADAGSGTAAILGPINFGGVNRTINVAAGGTLLLDGTLTNNATLSKQGAGTLVLTQDNGTNLSRIQLGVAAATDGGTLRVSSGGALGANQMFFNYGTLEASAPIVVGAGGFGGMSIGGRSATPVRLAGQAIEVTGSIGLFGTGSAGPIRVNVDNSSTFSAIMVGNTTSLITGLTFGGTGSLQLTGNGSGLTLPVNLTDSIRASVVNDGIVPGGGVIAGSFTVGSSASLGGNGTIGGVRVDAGGTLSPGLSPGVLTTTGSAVFADGGNYNWQLFNATGAAGSGWDLLAVGSTLDIAATSANPFRINLWTLSGTGPDVSGSASNFASNQSYTWTIASATTGITGFSADKFVVRTSATNGTGGFANTFGNGTFSIAQSGNDLNLVYTPGAPSITITVGSGTQTQTQAGYPLLSGSTPVVKAGAGTLVVDQANTLTGSTTVEAGRLQLANSAALGSSLLVPLAGGTVTLTPGLQTTVGGLSPNAGGLVDVGNGLVTVAAGLSAPNMVAAILTGLGDGSWNGTSGITSSVAAASGGDRTVGWLDNGDGTVTFGFAAAGDTNLDWTVDITDVANFLAGGKFDSGTPASWNEGDFTYDGTVDILDAASFLSSGLFDAGAYNAAPGQAGAIAAVPEPAAGAAGLLAAAAAVLLARRRRSTV